MGKTYGEKSRDLEGGEEPQDNIVKGSVSSNHVINIEFSHREFHRTLEISSQVVIKM